MKLLNYIFVGLIAYLGGQHPVLANSFMISLNAEGKIVKGDAQSLVDLFPERFTAEQIGDFNSARPIRIGNATLTIDDQYTQKVKGYFFQVLTAKNTDRANQITFTNEVRIQGGHAVGVYRYESAYGGKYSADFTVKLEHPDLKVVNTAQPVARGISLNDISGIRDEFIDQSNNSGLSRISVNLANWILILKVLNGEVVSGDRNSELALAGERIIEIAVRENYLDADHGYTHANIYDHTFTVAQYKAMNKTLLTEMMEKIGLEYEDLAVIDEIWRLDPTAIPEGRAYFVKVPSRL